MAIADVEIDGADLAELTVARSSGIDHGGNPVEPFVDAEGGWPLRCCLTDSEPGEQLAIVAWCPFPWSGAYAEVGPIVVHAVACAGPITSGLPGQFLSRPQIVRPYGHDRRIAYDHAALVEPDGSLPTVLRGLLSRDEVDFVIVRNVKAGCYSFTARRSAPAPL
jgi:hypothetical protein